MLIQHVLAQRGKPFFTIPFPSLIGRTAARPESLEGLAGSVCSSTQILRAISVDGAWQVMAISAGNLSWLVVSHIFYFP